MKCPKCRKNITRVVITSKCWQYGDIVEAKDSNLAKPRFLITNYGSIEEIYENLEITCPDCDADISEYARP